MRQRELYKVKLESQLVEWENKLLLLKTRVLENNVNNKVNLRLNDQIEKLQQNLIKGKEKLTVLQHTLEKSFEIFKDGAKATWELIKLRIDKIISALKHKLNLKTVKSSSPNIFSLLFPSIFATFPF